MLEIIATSLQDAKEGLKGGAQRLELVSCLAEGGLTPSDGLIQSVLKLPVEVAVMLRPFSKSFCYSEEDLTIMARDLMRMEEIGVDRVVIGALTQAGDVDTEFLKKLFNGSKMKATFHRAIDESRDIFESLEKVSEIHNFTHVLSSGGPGNAIENMEVLKKMMDGPLRIIVGSGVDLENMERLTKAFCGRNYDLHLGRAVRGGGVQGGVQKDLVKKAREGLKNT